MKTIIFTLLMLVAVNANATFYSCGNGGAVCAGPYYGYHRDSVRISRTKGYYIANCSFTAAKFVRYLNRGKYNLWANYPGCYYMVVG